MRNPRKGDLVGALVTGAGAATGAVASRIVPQILGAELNTGMLGYAANLGVGMVMYALLPAGSFSTGALAGAIAATLMRALSDSGMASYGLGAYWPSFFAVPTVSNPIGQVLSSPYPARVA